MRHNSWTTIIMDNKQIRALKAQAHALKPVASIGSKGLTDSVTQEIAAQLEHHELIKVKVAADREGKAAIAQTLCDTLQATLVGTIGHIVILYRKRKDN